VSRSLRQEAFTLLEMLIAIAITAMLIAVAVQAHLGIRRAQARAEAGLRRDHTAEILLDRIERELLGTVLLVKHEDEERLGHPFVFIGRDGSEGERDADDLHFVTRTPARVGLGQPAAGLVLVSYGARESDDFGLVLLREESPLPRRLEARVGLSEGEVVADELARFDVRYLGEESAEWTDRWDSTSVATPDALPSRLEIVVQLHEWSADGEAVEGREHTRSIALPVRPIDLEQERAARAVGDEPVECTTNDQCLELFGDLVAAGTPQKRQQILNLVVDIVDDCYDSASAFAKALRGLGADADDQCQ
jgi:prepilin-type N-terminal cleavage/methylation domain-containing protein